MLICFDLTMIYLLDSVFGREEYICADAAFHSCFDFFK